MKNWLKSVFCLVLIISLFGCNISLSEEDNGTIVDENIAEEEFVDVEYNQAVILLDQMIKSGKTYKCELDTVTQEFSDKQILYIKGENYRGEGIYEDFTGVLPKITSFALGKRFDGNKYCTYLWSNGKIESEIKEGGLMACLDNFRPAKPYEVGELGQGAFNGVSVELLQKCQPYAGKMEIQFEPSAEIKSKLADWSELGKLASAINNTQ
jgi:hypothetical protein